MKVREIGEQGLLKILQQFCPSEIIGDDGAVLSDSLQELLVITTDMLIDGVHFSDRTTSARDVGWRAAAANLSDLAAMGATPIGITIALGVPPDTAVEWIEQLYQGMTSCLNQYETSILGGDVARSPVITVAITAFGQVGRDRVVRRNAAQPGDAIVITGAHGASRAGLELLLRPELSHQIHEAERNRLITAHQRPQPRLDVLPLLWQVKAETATGEQRHIFGGMDSSDGLADAILQICRASGVGARIERSQIPILPAIESLVSPEQAMNWALYGGEDFELVLCLPDAIAQSLVAKLGQPATIVGHITMNQEIILTDAQKIYPDEQLALNRGFQHF